jgi:predicted RNA binding protein YcfA (HicA-like mRNA interferase family)
MPRKKRDIRRGLRKAGFVETRGKGDHTKFRHPLLRKHVVVDGADGATYAEAAKKGEDMLAFLIETFQQEGTPLPEPKVFVA